MTKRFTVEAGRQIYRDGKPFISIGREGDTPPVVADEMTHAIATLLNGTRDMREELLGKGEEV